MQRQPSEVFYKKAVLLKTLQYSQEKEQEKRTGRARKHPCWSLFSIQNVSKNLTPPILKNTCEALLLIMFS